MSIRENIHYWILDLTEPRGESARVARHLNVSKQAVTNWRTGDSSPDIEYVAQIAIMYGIPLTTILTTKPDGSIDTSSLERPREETSMTEVPLYGAIAAGTPIEMLEVDGTYPIATKLVRKYPDAFLLKVEGDSMSRIIPDGSYAVINPCDRVDHDGKPYAVCVNGYDATIKRVHLLNNGFELIPDSYDPTYSPAVFNYNEPGTDTITIIGEVVYYVLPDDWSF